MECGPAGMAAVEIDAVPWLRATGAPKSAPSTRNCTEPVAVPSPTGGEIVAVKVRDCPTTDGLGPARNRHRR